MSIAEVLLVLGTFGICTGVWTTLIVIIKHHKINQLDMRNANMGAFEDCKDYECNSPTEIIVSTNQHE